LGTAVVNPATGRLYIGPSGQSRRVNPANFKVTENAFGVVQAVDPDKDRLYALSGENLQIVNGKPDPEKITATVDLGYSPAGVVVDRALGLLYLSNPAKSCVEVRSGSTGALIGIIPLQVGMNPGSLAVDSARKRLYVLAAKEDQHLLFVISNVTAHSVSWRSKGKQKS
jgi:DNA-binding beta-propeller fold protein YncE